MDEVWEKNIHQFEAQVKVVQDAHDVQGSSAFASERSANFVTRIKTRGLEQSDEQVGAIPCDECSCVCLHVIAEPG